MGSGQLIRNLYPGVIQKIMTEYGIESVDNPNHIILSDTGFAEVIQYTEWFTFKGDSVLFYRYRRYSEILNYLKASDKQVAHVDIGCGAGLFSWVLLDQAKIRGIRYDQVSLYGLDHSHTAVHLAGMIRERLLQNIHDYPDLNYFTDDDALLNKLTESHRIGTDYIITFGHVLVQANATQTIQNFARIIADIVKLMDNQSSCMLIGSDARGYSGIFPSIWDSLLSNLKLNGICHDSHNLVASPINDGNCAKRARLYFSG